MLRIKQSQILNYINTLLKNRAVITPSILIYFFSLIGKEPILWLTIMLPVVLGVMPSSALSAVNNTYIKQLVKPTNTTNKKG